MGGRIKIAFFCYLLAAFVLAVFGLVYFFRPEFMPYHARAVGKTWAELEPGIRWLMLAFLRIIGGGWMAIAAAIGIMAFIPFRRGEAWARLAVPIVGLISGIASLYGTLLVKLNTPGSPPWQAPALGLVLIVVGFLFSLGHGSRRSTA